MALSETAAIGKSSAFQKFAPIALVLCACLFNLFAYQSELTIPAPEVNDHVYHLAMIHEMDAAWEVGENPRDTWIPYWGQGFPVLRYYQHLPHYAVVLLHRATLQTVSLDWLFRFLNLFLLTIFPLTVYVGSRWLGLPRFAAAFAALLAPLVDADPMQRHYLGLQARNFLWIGGGLFTQLAGMVLFPMALGRIKATVVDGKRFAPSLALLLALWLSHLLLGYMACLVGILFLFSSSLDDKRGNGLLRLLILYGLTALAASYILLPSLLESKLLAKSVWEDAAYWDSFGALVVLRDLVTGRLLDARPFPSISILALAGILFAFFRIKVARRKAEFEWFLVAGFTLSLLLFFGRPFWGSWLFLLPFSDKLPLHRFICAVQFFGIFLAGYGLYGLWRSVFRVGGAKLAIIPLIVSVLFLLPAVDAIWSTSRHNEHYRQNSYDNFQANGPVLADQMAHWQEKYKDKPGRGYAGTSWDWGAQYKLSEVPVYAFWARYGLPSISYMYHTMGLNSDLEPYFDSMRIDHCNLFNIRYLMSYSPDHLPEFANERNHLPGIYAASVDTPGYFDIVQTDAFFDFANSDQQTLFRLNKEFIASAYHANKRHFRIGWKSGSSAMDEEKEIGNKESIHNVSWKAHVPEGSILSSALEEDIYKAHIHMNEKAFLLFRTTYHPNWLATVDGLTVSTEMLSPSYIGIPLEPGDHHVELKYQSPWWTAGLFWLGLIMIPFIYISEKTSIGRRLLSVFESPYQTILVAWKRALKIVTGSESNSFGWLLFAIGFAITRYWLLFHNDQPWSDVPLYFQHYVDFDGMNSGALNYFSKHQFEYPPLLLPFMLIPGWLNSLFGTVTLESYTQTFKYMMLFLDLFILLVLPSFIRSINPNVTARDIRLRLFLYLPMLPLLAAVAYLRLDLIIAAFIFFTFVLASKLRLKSAAFILGLAGAMKLFPLLLAAPLLIWRMANNAGSNKWKPLGVIASGMLGLLMGVIPFILFFGLDAVKFINYQQGRGLQMESIPASLGMIAGFFGLKISTYNEAMAMSLAFNGSDALKTAWYAIGIIVLLALLMILWIRRNTLADKRIGLGFALTWSLGFLAMGIFFSSIFSPQFLILFLPLVVALPLSRGRLSILAGLFIALLALSTAIFPHFYLNLVDLKLPGVGLVLARNLLFAVFSALLLIWAIKQRPSSANFEKAEEPLVGLDPEELLAAVDQK